jgi:hypothetical protein
MFRGMWVLSVLVILSSAGYARGETSPTIEGRLVPAPLYGVTLDDLSNVDAEAASLGQLNHMPTTRLVFDPGESASTYAEPIQTLRDTSYIMGLLVDSSAMAGLSVAAVQKRAKEFAQTLGNQVDIWEIGNEVNGDWLGKNTVAKIEAMYDVIANQNGATALTFFYEGEPSEANNCIATDKGGNDMFTWITQMFQLNLPVEKRSAETEKIRLHLNYALISWYPDQCVGENPDWSQVYSRLASIFPNAKVGFGELGTAKPQNGSQYEIDEINQYYPMARTLPLPRSYIGGYFWWYYAEEMVPATKTGLFDVLNQAIK